MPPRWVDDRCLGEVDNLAVLVARIRKCDEQSDQLLIALIDKGPGDQLAAELVLASLLRLRVGRCRGVQERVDALASELAVVLTEAWRGELVWPPGRRLANVMADRAWGRVRAAERKGAWMNFSGLGCTVGDVACGSSFESAVVEAVALRDLGDRIERGHHGPVSRAWATVARYSESPPQSRAERSRYQYARRTLRAHVTDDLELV